MKRGALGLATAAVLILIFSANAFAAQQYQGLCARVKIEILQELTLERVGFLATLEITNNEGDADITDFSAMLTFENPALSSEENTDDASSLFFVQPPELSGISVIDGNGIIPSTRTAVIKWFIIPKIAAGGIDASGVRYRVGAALAGSIYGQPIAPEILAVIPDSITVRPEPQLDITYFQPRDVDGDNPFTVDVVESPIPFTVGVLVRNTGYGTARSVKIVSQQPRIVENKEGLLLIAQLLGSRVNDTATPEASLTVNLGDIPPGGCRKGAWDMITSLSGEFIEFKASYTHSSELGGQETSIISAMNAWFIAREVLNDQPGRDALRDFLADTDNDPDMLPDTLFESDCNTLPVNHLANATATGTGLTATVTVNADRQGWVYMRVTDPAQAKYPVAGVVRSDGKHLNNRNYWTNVRYSPGTNQKLTYLNLFDFVNLGDYEYTVTYGQATADTTAPVTQIRFSGEVQQSGGKYYILPDTQVYFTVEDDSPVATSYRLDAGAQFAPAYPFNLETGGEYAVEFFSEDNAGNGEPVQTAVLVVSADYPGVAGFTLGGDELFYTGQSVSILPTRLDIDFQGTPTASRLDADIDIFRGVAGWATVGNVPSSPTAATSASLAVDGENVNFYRFHRGDGAWSAERPVAEPIVLTGLAQGTIDVYVQGRSEYGAFPPDDAAVHVFWVVDPAAPATAVANAPFTPTRQTGAELTVSGADAYKYTIDSGYYRPEAPAATPLIMTGLNEGDRVISVIGKSGGEWQAEAAATTVGWTVDRDYGFDLSALPLVRHVEYTDIGAALTRFQWDGTNDAGVVLPPGWYTVRLTVRDELGRSSHSVRLVQVGNLMPEAPLFDGGLQKNAHASGRWAVWQDQASGNWDIYAIDLLSEYPAPAAITADPLNQEKPKTDGAWAVWETRRTDGTRDIRARELGGAGANIVVTDTAGTDEQNPAISWPWVVYQAKPVSNPAAPWQLKSYHLGTGETAAVDATGQDQLDPALSGNRVVWQDFRDAGYGEIYCKDLKTGDVRRITNNPHSQYHPAISGDWIVWADTRETQSDIYGFHLLRRNESRITTTPENETRPFLHGKWVVYTEDSAGPGRTNLRLLHLDNGAAVQLTNFDSLKAKPVLASGRVFWQDAGSGIDRIMSGTLPVLQPVFNNSNLVAVTPGMAAYRSDAFTLLEAWNRQAGVTAITRFSSLVPQPVAETVEWIDGKASGTNFTLAPGTFLWVAFGQGQILDLGTENCGTIDLAAGTNVFAYWCFPDGFSAYRLIDSIGRENVSAVRLLDSGSGRWNVTAVADGRRVGEDFEIPRTAVLMIEMNIPLAGWRP